MEILASGKSNTISMLEIVHLSGSIESQGKIWIINFQYILVLHQEKRFLQN